MTHRLPIAVCTCLLAIAGCGARMNSGNSSETAQDSMPLDSRPAVEASLAGGEPDSALPTSQPEAVEGAAKRRIIYRADVDLVVEQFDPLPDQIEATVRQYDGFVSASALTGSPGRPRSGRWTIRIPVPQFSEFLAAVRRLGEVRTITTTSDDVTAEFYDVEARIRNKQREEERLVTLLTEATGKLEEVLTVERELSRVRGEIERAQGRLRMLKDVTELTTVTVSVSEVKDYVPEQSPSYATRVRRAFASSTAAAIATAQALSLVVVALVPWLPAPVVLVLIVVMLRSLRRVF